MSDSGIDFELPRRWAERKDLTVGMWKFRDTISVNDLVILADKWAKSDRNWLDLHVRKCSKDQRGIGFKYKHTNAEGHKQFFERMTDELKRKFGNDFVGWDVSSITWVVKQDFTLGGSKPHLRPKHFGQVVYANDKLVVERGVSDELYVRPYSIDGIEAVIFHCRDGERYLLDIQPSTCGGKMVASADNSRVEVSAG